MKRLAIIPARSGSKGLRNKNIIDLCGKPLMAWSIEAATQTDLFDKVLVSTDSEHYADIARQWGADVMMRGEAQSSDTATTYDVMEDLLGRLTEDYDYFMQLQPTSPLRSAKHVREAIELFDARINEFDFLTSVKVADHPRVLVHELDEHGALGHFHIDYSRYRRQNYHDITPNGAIQIAKIPEYLAQKHYYGSRSLGYEMNNIDSVDIDSALDLMVAAEIIKRGLNTL